MDLVARFALKFKVFQSLLQDALVVVCGLRTRWKKSALSHMDD